MKNQDGAKLVQDPYPSENFFRRSDNYTLAHRGIVAYTVSNFGLHTDYHKASDEIKTIDFDQFDGQAYPVAAEFKLQTRLGRRQKP